MFQTVDAAFEMDESLDLNLSELVDSELVDSEPDAESDNAPVIESSASSKRVD